MDNTVWLSMPDIPATCGECFRAPPDGTWPLGIQGGRLALICPVCHTVVAFVVAGNPAP